MVSTTPELSLRIYDKCSAVAEMDDRLATTDMGRKLRGLCPFYGGSRVPIYHNVVWADTYLRTTWHLDPSSRWATIDMGRKVGVVPLFREGEAGSPSNTMSPGPTPIPPYQVTSSSNQPFGHNRHEPKIEVLCPFREVGAGSPSNTMWPGPRPTSVPSFILINPAV